MTPCRDEDCEVIELHAQGTCAAHGKNQHRVRGGIVAQANRAGTTPERYIAYRDQGLKFCNHHREWEARVEFGVSRKMTSDGRDSVCKRARRELNR